MANHTKRPFLLNPFTDIFTQKKSIRGFDGLRGVCVIAVLAAHAGLTEAWDTGTAAVWIFFALSGYLIVPLLFKARGKIEEGISTFGKELKGFLRDRAVRIFPVYYLLLFLMLLSSFILNSNAKILLFWDALPWLLSYTSNIYIAFIKGEFIGQLSHFWSLAIEQQFYTFFPFLALTLPQKYWFRLIPALAFMMITVSLLSTRGEQLMFLVSSLSGMYAILVGGWFGLIAQRKNSQVESPRMSDSPLNLLLLIFVQHIIFVIYDMRQVSLVLTPILASFMLLMIRRQQNSRSVNLLEAPWLRALGVVSYGFYLFHNFIPGPVRNAITNATSIQNELLLNIIVVIISYIVTFSLSACSYSFFEKWFLVLKKEKLQSSNAMKSVI